MSQLDDYAAQGRALRKREKPGASRPKKRTLSPEELLGSQALAGDTSGWALVLSAAGMSVAFVVWYVTRGFADVPVPEIAAGVCAIAGIAGSIVALGRMRTRGAERARAWLASLPFAGDWKAYESALGKQRFKAHVQVRARFCRPLASAEATRVGDAALGMIGKGSTSCPGDVLTISSPELKTHFRASGDRDSYYSNVRIHAWVRRVLVVLLRIHGEHALERVDIDADG